MHNVLNLDADQMHELDETISEMLKFIQENPLTINILEKFNVCHEYLQSHGMNVLNYSLLLAYAIQDFVKEYSGNWLPRRGLRQPKKNHPGGVVAYSSEKAAQIRLRPASAS